MSSKNPAAMPRHKRYAISLSYNPVLDRARLRGKAAVEQMGFDFLMFAASAGSVSQDDMELIGWTATQVTLHSTEARRFANRYADRMRGASPAVTEECA